MNRVTFSTPIGRCAVSWEDAGLTQFELPEAAAGDRASSKMPAEISSLIQRVRAHLGGELQDFSHERFAFERVPAFAKQIYRAALAIKPGHTATYGELAIAVGQPVGVSRAVGAALGANPWPLLVPCHRIVAATGKMTGFSGPGGVNTKVKLLALEGAQLFAE